MSTHLQQTTFKNIMTKEEIAHNEQFLLLPQSCPLLVIGYPFNYRDFLYSLTNCVQSRLLQISCMRRRVKLNEINRRMSHTLSDVERQK